MKCYFLCSFILARIKNNSSSNLVRTPGNRHSFALLLGVAKTDIKYTLLN